MVPSAGAFPGAADAGRLPAAGQGILSGLDAEPLKFVTEMFAVQLDQFAALLADRGEPVGETASIARDLLARWRAAGYMETDQLSPGEPWVWATRRGLDACGLRTRLVKPAVRLLRHTHAVTDVRLAVQRTAAFRRGRAWWRSERSILSEAGFPARTEHVPDGEVRWPDGTDSPWAGEAWAVEIEISRKSVEATAKIMHEVLTQTGDPGRASASTPMPALAPRYARLVYACSGSTVQTVLNARAEVGLPLSARIDIHDLPESATRLNTPKRRWQP
jgi:hypothetical protein